MLHESVVCLSNPLPPVHELAQVFCEQHPPLQAPQMASQGRPGFQQTPWKTKQYLFIVSYRSVAWLKPTTSWGQGDCATGVARQEQLVDSVYWWLFMCNLMSKRCMNMQSSKYARMHTSISMDIAAASIVTMTTTRHGAPASAREDCPNLPESIAKSFPRDIPRQVPLQNLHPSPFCHVMHFWTLSSFFTTVFFRVAGVMTSVWKF